MNLIKNRAFAELQGKSRMINADDEDAHLVNKLKKHGTITRKTTAIIELFMVLNNKPKDLDYKIGYLCR